MSIPATTRAAVLTDFEQPLQLRELPLPDELDPGAVLVRISRTTLCGTDVEIWQGKMGLPNMLPMVLGHEMVGTIAAAGAEARDVLGRRLQVGDRIGWSESTCGECYGCRVLRQPVACERRGYGFLQRSDVAPFATGGLVELCYVTERAEKLLLPEAVGDTLAAMAGCAAKTVLRAFDRAGSIRVGASVVIQGSGALGLFATAVARLSGAGRVITIGAPARRLEQARRFGADLTLDITDGSDAALEAVLEATDGRGADLVMDFAGAPSVGAEAVAMAGQGATIVIVGSTAAHSDPIALGAVMGKELSLVGSLNGDISDYHHAIEFFTRFADRMPWNELFDPVVPLSGASAALLSMSRHEATKAVIDPSA